jgi:hypothetical protein
VCAATRQEWPDASAPFYPRRAAWYTYAMSMEKSDADVSAGAFPAINPAKIEVRPTPNPNARKFVLAGIHFGASRNYALGTAVDDPLGARLLLLDGVYNVLLAQDFVTVNKVPEVEWPPLEAAVIAILSDYLSQHATHHAG